MIKYEFDNNIDINNEILKLKKNPLFKDYKINSFNFNNFLIMSNEINNCNKCNGLEECMNPIKGYIHEAFLNGNSYIFKINPCKYKNAVEKKDLSNSLIKTKYISKAILNSTLEDFKLNTLERKKAYQYVAKFVTEYNKDNYMKGLYLHGSFCTGKTYLLAAIANELSKRNLSSLLIYFPDLCRVFKQSMNDNTLEDIINELKTVDILMIDDLGGEMLSSWIRDEIIGPVLNYRMQEELPIFISSNLDLDQMYSHFEQTKDEAYNKITDETKAGRIYERIKQMTIFVSFKENRFDK